MTQRWVVVSLALVGTFAAVSTTDAQLAPNDTAPGTPGWVVEMFVARPSFPDRERHLIAPLARQAAGFPTPGARLPPGATAVTRVLQRDSARAVYATSIRTGPRAADAQDVYTYLVLEDGRWKVAALRSLAIPEIQYVLVDSMDAKRHRGELPDSLVPVLDRMRLGAQPDSALRAYVREHESDLRKLAERFTARRDIVAASVDGEAVPSRTDTADARIDVADLVPAMRRLLIGAVMRYEEHPQCIVLKIGGSGSHQVGFIYAPSTCQPPPMTPDQYIYVEAAAPHWYVYKRL